MEIWLHPALRFAHYALLLGLFGLVAFRAIGLPASMARAASGNARLAVGAAIMAPAVSLALMLVGIAEMMGQPVSELERETIAAMVLQTSVGWAFLARLLVLVTAALVLLYSARSPGWTPVVAVLYALALITLPWSGHAAAGEGMAGSLHRLTDAAHLMAAGLWIGAIGWFLHLIKLAHRAPDRLAAASLLGIMHRFAPFGVLLVMVVTVTGIINTVLITGWAELRALLVTSYGWLLIAKVAAVGLMLMCGARNAALSRTAVMQGGTDSTQSALAALRISLASEVGLAAIVIGLVAILGLASPMP